MQSHLSHNFELPEHLKQITSHFLQKWNNNPTIQVAPYHYSSENMSGSQIVDRKKSSQSSLQNNWPRYEPKTLPHNNSSTLNKLALFGVVILFIFMLVDVKHDVEAEISKTHRTRQYCFKDFTENNCETPVDIMIQKCKELEECVSQDIHHTVRITASVAKVSGSFIRIFLEHLQIAGIVLIITVLLLRWIFKKNHNRQLVNYAL